MSIKNDGHYFCRAGGNRPDGLNEPVTFKKGSAHITFRKPELVDRLNEIIAKHYPGVLPS
ncbi:DUF4942 domain-containing protein [Escherichia coli]|nr:DUF4942 domain-containing protein [Escherichia coli]